MYTLLFNLTEFKNGARQNLKNCYIQNICISTWDALGITDKNFGGKCILYADILFINIIIIYIQNQE